MLVEVMCAYRRSVRQLLVGRQGASLLSFSLAYILPIYSLVVVVVVVVVCFLVDFKPECELIKDQRPRVSTANLVFCNNWRCH